MSYKSKKQKNTLRNRIQIRVRMFRIILSRFAQDVRYKLSGRKGNEMFLPQTRTIMSELRRLVARIRPNNKKVDTWVDEYINSRALKGEDVQLLTQWCLSKDLEVRKEKQGGSLKPLASERKLLQEDIPQIIRLFKTNGVRVSWWFTCNQSFMDRGRISDALVDEYLTMLRALASDVPELSESAIILDWEKDVLGARPQPSPTVLQEFTNMVSPEAFRIDVENLLRRARQYGVRESDEELREGARFKIACEAEEGRFLLSNDSPFPGGEFILVPLEFPERYVFFETLAPDFSRRVVALAKPYPWRLDAADLVYEP
jgi:hypothetical protein